MCPSCEEFIFLRTISSSQPIVEINNWPFVFIYWFDINTCFIFWILIGWSGYYMNRSFVAYFVIFFQRVICFTTVSWACNDLTMVFIGWNTSVVDIASLLRNNPITINVISFLSIVTLLAYNSIFFVIIFIYFFVTCCTISNLCIYRSVQIEQNNSR